QNGNTITDDTGNALQVTLSLAILTPGTFKLLTGFFSLPRQLPVTVNVQVGLIVASSFGAVISMDLCTVTTALVPLYAGGPYLVRFAGATRGAVGDNWKAQFTNSLGTKSFAVGMDRLYNMKGMNVYFPSASSPTISDSLVTH